MKRVYPTTTIWPFIGVAIGLFVCSVRAPNRWFGIGDWPTCTVAPTYVAMARRPLPPAPRQSPSVPAPAGLSIDHMMTVPIGAAAASDTRAGSRISLFRAEPAGPAEGMIWNLGHSLNPYDPSVSVGDDSSVAIPSVIARPLKIEEEMQTLTAAISQPAPATPMMETAQRLSASSKQPRGNGGGWCEPTVLIRRLRALHDPAAQSWAQQVIDGLRGMTSPGYDTNDQISKGLNQLRQLQDGPIPAGPASGELGQLQYALGRQLDIWQHIHRARLEKGAPQGMVDGQTMAQALDEVESLLQSHDAGPTWKEYLRLNGLRGLTTTDSPGLLESRARLARDVLHAQSAPQLTDEQRAWLARPEFTKLRSHLRVWAAPRVEHRSVLEAMERCEDEMTPEAVQRLTELMDRLRWSESTFDRQLAVTLDQYYRNANFRLSCTAELLNRLIPAWHRQRDPVRETILGAAVTGHSDTLSRLSVALVPDAQRIRLSVLAQGTVHSNTNSRKGPVLLRGRGTTEYLVEKPIWCDGHGLHMEPARARALDRSGLPGITSQLDGVPLLGWLIREVAKQQHFERRGEVRSQVQNRVATKACRRLDAEIEQQEQRLRESLQQVTNERLRQVGLVPEITDMQTTHERLTFRCRVASPYQLGAHTARPQALRNSMLSIQVHESLLNNLLDQLQLAGWRGPVENLITHVATRLNTTAPKLPEDFPEGIWIELAAEQPVRIRCVEDRLQLRIAIEKFITPRRRWKSFQVVGYYRPDLTQREADLMRDGTIELIGTSVGLRDQVALRGIFTRVLSKNDRWSLLGGRLVQHARLVDLAVTQFVVRDGWFALSVGRDYRPLPVQVASEPSNADQVSTK